MTKIPAKLKKHLASVLVFGSLSVLTGCGLPDPELDNFYEPATHYDRYPIEVKPAVVTQKLQAKLGILSTEDIDAAIYFAEDARKHARSKVSVKWPSGSAKSRAPASHAVQILVRQGVPRNMIALSSYKGKATAPIQMSYLRKVAVTKECGDWSENLSLNGTNTAYPNFGCAQLNNIAAMVKNPEEFERPRPISLPPSADRIVTTPAAPAAP